MSLDEQAVSIKQQSSGSFNKGRIKMAAYFRALAMCGYSCFAQLERQPGKDMELPKSKHQWTGKVDLKTSKIGAKVPSGHTTLNPRFESTCFIVLGFYNAKQNEKA